MATENSAAIRVFLINGQRCVLWGLERLIETQQPAMQVAGTSPSYAEALERIGSADPDLILLDLDSAHEDGLAAIAELKARSRARILVLTGSRDDSLHDDAVLCGASGVVRKESPAETIVSAINKVHAGELWLDRAATGRIFCELSKLRSSQTADPDQARISSLTARERQIVALATDHPGANAKALARMLGVSEHTLRNHFTSIYEKLGVPGRIAMYAFAQKNGLTADSRSPRRPVHSSFTPHNGVDSAASFGVSVDAEIEGAGRARSVQGANG
jgi:DNA-binding NarL/FixJ family response regulator